VTTPSPTTRARSSPGRNGQNVAAVHERLRTAILHGELQAGASVPQSALETEFDAGRTPVREALRLLQREGLVIAEPNRPVQIASLSADDFEELYVMRIALEAVAIRVTVPLLTSDDFAELEACFAKMDHYQRAGDQAGLRVPHRTFHSRLVSGVGRRGTAEITEMADHSERYRLRFGAAGDWADRRTEHRAILDSAARRDPDGAAESLAVHYAHTANLVFNILDPGHDLGRLRTTLRIVAPAAEAALAGST
jgi:DNA-binding GntR family transcriptional regulator